MRPVASVSTAVEGDRGVEPKTDGPLAGVRVLELGSLIAGPFAARLLADHGAEVIKIEAPGRPDPLRTWGQGGIRGKSLWWAVQSRNKKCVTLDLRDPDGRSVFLELVANSDVVIENFRPGTLERWDLGFERLQAARPGIILARVSGYGQTGPYADRPGFASVAEAMGGLRYINGFPGETPPRTGISLGDSLGGLFAALGVLAALHHRDARGGVGQVVDISLMESCFALMESALPEYDLLGIVKEPSGTGLKGIAPSNVFRCSDDRWVVIAANQDGLFRRLAEVMGRPELASDERFATHVARGEHQEELDAIIGEWAARKASRELWNLLGDSGVACGPIYTIADIADDPQYQARGMLVEHRDPDLGVFRGPGIVPLFSETPGQVEWSGALRPGSHNEEVFQGLLGMSDERLTALRDAEVV